MGKIDFEELKRRIIRLDPWYYKSSVDMKLAIVRLINEMAKEQKMGMMIDDNVDFLNEAKDLFEDVANDPKIKETIKTYCIIDSLEIAIDTMRKYQQIEQILKDIPYGGDATVRRIQEVIEDGNDKEKI